jgi:ligand-binding SRPBCC domain-containing protein
MKVSVESVLHCPAEKVWDEVQRSSLLLEVTRPLVRIVPADGPQFPERWLEGATVRCKCYLFGIIPLGTHTIFMERIDPVAREIQSRESDPLIRRWDHLVRVRPTGDGRTHYSDAIIIEAGLLTCFVWVFAQWFYRHRQRRWRQVARRLVAAEPSDDGG